MKKLLILFFFCGTVSLVKAVGPSDLVIINPYSGPSGSETNTDEFIIEFYDMMGKKLFLECTVNPTTGSITVKGGTGPVIVSVTNKKTAEKKTQKIVFVNGG